MRVVLDIDQVLLDRVVVKLRSDPERPNLNQLIVSQLEAHAPAPAPRLTVFHTDTRMSFGRYQGSTIRWIIENDLSYALWLRDIATVKLSDGVLGRIKQAEEVVAKAAQAAALSQLATEPTVNARDLP